MYLKLTFQHVLGFRSFNPLSYQYGSIELPNARIELHNARIENQEILYQNLESLICNRLQMIPNDQFLNIIYHVNYDDNNIIFSGENNFLFGAATLSNEILFNGSLQLLCQSIDDCSKLLSMNSTQLHHFQRKPLQDKTNSINLPSN